MTKAKGAPKKTVLFGIGAAIILLLLTLVIYQVDSTEYAVVTQFGQPVRVVEDAGLKIKLPDPIQSVQRLDKRVQVYQTSSIELLTLDRLNVSLDYPAMSSTAPVPSLSCPTTWQTTSAPSSRSYR